ncbi:MAG: AAA family ATPase, partial [Stackebrandtia sp.]
TYNTALERHLERKLGLRFAERPDPDPRKRPIREVVGVDPALNTQWSKRRESINARRAELATQFQRDHGRPPTPLEAIDLAEQANLETRDAKHEPRTTAQMRKVWHDEAITTLGSAQAIDAMVVAAFNAPAVPAQTVNTAWVTQTAADIIERVSAGRATWSEHHVHAEAQRRIRGTAVRADEVETVVSLLVDEALEHHSVLLVDDTDPIAEPETLRRADGTSVFSVAGSAIYTSSAVLAAEQRIVTAAGQRDGRRAGRADVDLALAESATGGVSLNAGQSTLVREMATSGARVQLAIAAAGTGKTAAMRTLTRAWEESGGTVLGLAPSAAAATQLREQAGTATETLAKLIHELRTDRDDLTGLIGPNTLVLIDEAGMADTRSLDQAIAYATAHGASVRLIGDDQQLAAIGAGGVLRDIAATHGALRLAELMRFSDPAEGAASLALRDGHPEALGYYLDHDRVHVGDLATLSEDVFNAWQHDGLDGADSIMLAPTRELVHELNARAREARIAYADQRPGGEVRLADGNAASVGDTVITRHNNRRLRVSATDWVKNGDRWTVTAIDDGALQVRHTRSGLTAALPSRYVAEH